MFAQPKPVGSIFLKDGSRVEKFKDILDTLSEAEDWIDVWVTARKEFVSVGGETPSVNLLQGLRNHCNFCHFRYLHRRIDSGVGECY